MAEEWRINMQSLIDELKDEYDYSSYDIAMVKYVLTSIFYEFSKLIIFGIFFGFLGYFKSFLVSLILLLFLRINIGGIHCKHYITCFLLTFVVLFSSIILLPKLLFVAPILIISICTICMIINYKIGPIASPFRPSPDSILIKKCRNTGFLLAFSMNSAYLLHTFKLDSGLLCYIQRNYLLLKSQKRRNVLMRKFKLSTLNTLCTLCLALSWGFKFSKVSFCFFGEPKLPRKEDFE